MLFELVFVGLNNTRLSGGSGGRIWGKNCCLLSIGYGIFYFPSPMMNHVFCNGFNRLGLSGGSQLGEGGVGV